MSRKRNVWCLTIGLSMLGAVSQSAIAQQHDSAATTAIDVDIKSQPIGGALNELATQTGVQLVFFSNVTGQIQSEALIGTFPDRNAALNQLLSGTGLKYRYINDYTIAVESAEGVSEGKKLPALQSTMTLAQMPAQTKSSESKAPVAPKSSDDRAPIENVIVTGTRIRGAQNASPVITVSREDIDRGGFATTEELVRALPQNFAGGASQENSADWFAPNESGNAAGSGTSIDLRGLGPTSTLVLVNGRRISTGGFAGRFTDISSIPLSAIERVDVLTDGASAVYGSDAIGGVVNFVLLDDFDGAETRVRYSPDLSMDSSDVRFSQVFGKSWESGNALISYEYYKQDSLDNADRALTASTDLRPFGGDNWSLVGGNPGTIFAGGTSYAIPTNQNGTGLTQGDFVPGTINFDNGKDGQDLRGDQERNSVMAFLRQRFSNNVEFFLDARYSKRESERRIFQERLDLVVPESNPFFVDPSGTGLSEVLVENYYFGNDIGSALNTGDIETLGAVTGFVVDINENWQAEISGSFAQDDLKSTIGNVPDRVAVEAALADSNPDTAFNPFADGSNSNQGTLDAIRIPVSQVSRSKQEAWALQAELDGSLFTLPGGRVGIATGFQYREESLDNNQSDSNTGVASERDVSAVYAELFIPLVGPGNSRPGLSRLELSLAARYDDFSDVGDTTNPKIGLLWAPSDSLTFRATWGTSFRAPPFVDLDDSPSNFNFDAYAPFFAAPAIFRFGGNAELKPETATTWTAGLKFSPESVPGFTMEMNYFDILFEDRISDAGLTVFNFLEPRFSSVVNANPSQEEVTQIASSDRYRDIVGIDPQLLIDGLVPVDAIVPLGRVNVGESKINGMDLMLGYGFAVAGGQMALGLNSSYLFEYEDTLFAGEPSFERLNTVGNPVDLRIRGSASWIKGAWSASAFVNYTAGYTNNENPADEESIDSWTTVDFQVMFDTKDKFSSFLLNDTRVSLSIQNLLDEDPPFVNLSRGQAYDTTNASALGRWVALEVRKMW